MNSSEDFGDKIGVTAGRDCVPNEDSLIGAQPQPESPSSGGSSLPIAE
jgi:hypothetical protein